ncbi:MAG: D-alanine--D-alanine ligase [Bacteroidetes bacterium]|nr:MAG: D-alanine--D-alanine ligase [Bacteroidota bacterium]
MKKNVGILMGGYSSEFEISILSGQTVYNNLDRSLYTPFAIHILKDRWVLVEDGVEYAIDKNDFSAQMNGEKITFDLLFNAIHGNPGEDGILQGYLQLLNIPQTSCDVFESALTFNKAECNRVLSDFGVRVAPSIYLHPGENVDPALVTKLLNFPVFVKPSRSGSSFGVSRVENPGDLEEAVKFARTEDQRVVIEQGVIGTEVGCGVYAKDGKAEILALTEIVPKKSFFDYEAKYQGASEEITPARVSAEVESEIRNITAKVYELLHLKGVVRADYIVEQTSGLPYLIEVNTVPGLSPASIVPQQVRHAGMSLTDFFTLVLEETRRNSTKGA